MLISVSHKPLKKDTQIHSKRGHRAARALSLCPQPSPPPPVIVLHPQEPDRPRYCCSGSHTPARPLRYHSALSLPCPTQNFHHPKCSTDVNSNPTGRREFLCSSPNNIKRLHKETSILLGFLLLGSPCPPATHISEVVNTQTCKLRKSLLIK